jgi:predicted double-glycine peptidase
MRASGPDARHGRRATAVIAIWCSLLLASCFAAPANADRSDFLSTPSRNAVPPAAINLEPSATLLLDVRLDRQTASNSCGAHAVASLVDYWQRADAAAAPSGAVTGEALYLETPPATGAGYSLAEMVSLLERSGLVAVAVTTSIDAIKAELDDGRPVIARVSVATPYLISSTVFPSEAGLLSGIETGVNGMAARLMEPVSLGRLDHYWVVIGYDATHMIVMDPAMGMRAVRFDAFARAFDRGGKLAVVSGGWRRD